MKPMCGHSSASWLWRVSTGVDMGVSREDSDGAEGRPRCTDAPSTLLPATTVAGPRARPRSPGDWCPRRPVHDGCAVGRPPFTVSAAPVPGTPKTRPAPPGERRPGRCPAGPVGQAEQDVVLQVELEVEVELVLVQPASTTSLASE